MGRRVIEGWGGGLYRNGKEGRTDGKEGEHTRYMYAQRIKSKPCAPCMEGVTDNWKQE